MGYGGYDTQMRASRAVTDGYHTKSVREIFRENKVNEGFSPYNLNMRECFDSEDHPNTRASMFWLDVTGSMGHIPHMLVRDGLPHIMGTIIEKGTPDIALCFGAIGDHFVDSGPLQVSQFESADDKLDHWLTKVWLEGGGGGNGGESYGLAWYIAANHTNTDCWNKRKQKGILWTCGDEPIHREYSASTIKKLMGPTARIESDTTALDLLKKAQEKWHCYHFGIRAGGYDHSYWKELMGEFYIPVDNYQDIPKMAAEIALKHTKADGLGHSFTVDTPTNEAKPTSAGTPEDTDVVFIK